MRLNRTPSLYDRQWRNEENENWTMIEENSRKFSTLSEEIKTFIDGFDGEHLLEKSYNIFNKNTVVKGRLDGNTGDLIVVEGENWVTSEFIPVEPGKRLQIQPIQGITVLYDENYDYVRQIGPSGHPALIANNERFVRNTMSKASAENKYIYLGSEDLPYKDYGYDYSDKLVSLIESMVVGNNDVEDYINLFDKSKVVQGSINTTTGEVEGTSFVTSDFIPVKSSSPLIVLEHLGIGAFYDSNKEFIGELSGANAGEPFYTPVNAFYFRTSMGSSSIDNKMVYHGTDRMPYYSYMEGPGGSGEGSGASSGFNRITVNSNNTADITMPYAEGNDITFAFGQLGINEFWHLTNISTDDYNQRVSTDMISPYRLKAQSNPIVDNPIRVTGGNHGTSGGGGYRTGEPVSVKYFVDNQQVSSGSHSTENEIVVKVENKFCGYNTINLDNGVRRDIAKEIITYKFKDNNIEVFVTIEPLEPIEISQHRGIQFIIGHWRGSAYAADDDSGIKTVSSSGNTNFKSSSAGSEAQRLVSYNSDGHMLVMYMNELIDYGDFKHNDSDPRWFFSATKGYSNLTDTSQSLQYDTGETVSWSGGYYFGKGLNYPHDSFGKAYLIKRNGKTVYCAEDQYARDGYIGVLPRDENKEVKIIKNNGYTVGDYTTSKGLKFSKSAGIGSLMFEVI